LAVLCRTRNQFEAIAKALRDHHVPYQETGTVPFFQQEPFQSFTDIISAFLLENYKTAAPLFKLKKLPVTKVRFDLAKVQMQKSGLVPFLNFIRDNHFPSKTFGAEEWNRFTTLARQIKNVSGFLHFLKLGTGTDAHIKNMEAVSIMTLHTSKGLEFECVFIPGCEEGLLPYSLYKKQVDVEEEKRLLYVGMTRAKKLLYLTYSKSRTIRGRKFNLPKSPFLGAIQQELLQQIKNKPPKKPGEKDNQLSLF
jgi:superfamily I DNA/RNA helicase